MIAPIQQVQQIVADHPGWNWVVMISTAIASWIAPVAGFVTIACAVLHAYIAWKKYQHWQKTKDDARS